MIFFQGDYPSALARRQPGLSVPTLSTIHRTAAKALTDRIASYARLTRPSLVIEDTHPALYEFPPDIARFLIVRPATLDYMRSIQRKASGLFERCIIFDDPASPLWPYSEAATAEIASWRGWSWIGPAFRHPSQLGIQRVRERYALREGEPAFVFSLGGGGEQTGSGDRSAFVRSAEEIGRGIRAALGHARLLFVCGPLFPREIEIPSLFEAIPEEPELPSLFAVATGAVVRASSNAFWECIAAQTPFLPIVGKTFAEPVESRIAKLRRSGFDVPQNAVELLDSARSERFKARCREVLERFSGSPAEGFIAALDVAPKPRSSPGTVPASQQTDFDRLVGELRALPGRKEVLLRLDDVVELDEELQWFHALCARLSLPASLEVIPYLASLSGAQLARLDPQRLFEIGQHGYAHLPESTPRIPKGEFVEDSAPTPATKAILARGLRSLRIRFGARFKGGYSAPFDGLPPWFAAVWVELGGRYISWINRQPHSAAAGAIRLELDPWDWPAQCGREPASLASQALAALRLQGFVGIVLHPQLLRETAHRATVERLVAALVEGGCRGVAPSDAVGRTRVPIF